LEKRLKEAFVYCWTNKTNGKLYIGVHKGTIDDGYICSSKMMLEDFSFNSESFSRQIIAEGDYKEMLNFEKVILRACNAAKADAFYNMHSGNGRPYRKVFSSETKEKQSQSQKERWSSYSDDMKKLISERISNSNKGRLKSEEHKKSMRGKRPHVNQKGNNNNFAKKIVTPYGIFYSLKEAAEKLNMKYDSIHYKLKTKHDGWDYI